MNHYLMFLHYLQNLLISIMSTSLDRVTANEGIRLLLSKAQVIDELEATVPRWIERRFCELFPPFLHVLRIDTHRMDTAAADALWACSADQEGSGNLLDGSSHPQGDFGCAGAGKEGANETQENGGRVVQRIEARAGGSEARDQRPSEGEGVSPRGGHLSESPWGSEAMARMGKLEEQLGEVLYELKVLRDEVRARHARV